MISHEDGTIKDNLSINGTRIVSFAPVLKWETIPFSELSKEILSIGKKALGCPVEIEFAVNIKKDSKPELKLISFEKSMYRIITNEMLDIISGINAFNNLKL